MTAAKTWLVPASFALLFSGIVWVGCGGDDDGDTKVFADVASVTPTTVVSVPQTDSMFAQWLPIPREAHAVQGANCTPPSLGLLTFCVFIPDLGDAGVCGIVDQMTCSVRTSLNLPKGQVDLDFIFVDDGNENVALDAGESTAEVPTNQTFRNHDKIEITNINVNFITGIASGDVEIVDGPSTNPPGPGPQPGPGPGPQPGPPYSYGASLNEPPSTMFAMLLGLGVALMLLPGSRRRQR